MELSDQDFDRIERIVEDKISGLGDKPSASVASSGGINELSRKIDRLIDDIRTLDTSIGQLSSRIGDISTDVDRINSGVVDLDSDINSLGTRLGNFSSDIASLQNRVSQIPT
jgi:outer membrane murein-binding lipoprotein Lpp